MIIENHTEMKKKTPPTTRVDISEIPTPDNTFKNEGFFIFKGFLSLDLLNKINNELDMLLKYISINRNIMGSAFVSKTVKEINIPLSLKSINLLEVSIDIAQKLFGENKKNYIVTNIEIFSEKNNPKPLFWHTDQRKGMIRAQIYLKGGEQNSGGFLFMRGTHAIEHLVTHKLSKEEIDQLKPYIVDCSGSPGDLVCFDSFGFHAKNACKNERRTIMFEFQEKHSMYSKASLLINNQKLSNKVIQNLDLFLPGDSSTYGAHGSDSQYNPISTQFLFSVVKTYFRYQKEKLYWLLSLTKRKLLSQNKQIK
jgi:hypothetical protein